MRRIAQVERLRPELQVEPVVVSELVVLKQTEVQVVDPVPTRIGKSAWRSPVSKGHRLAEHGGVEPLIEPRNCGTAQLGALAVIVRT